MSTLLYTVDYTNTKAIQAFTSSRRTSAASSSSSSTPATSSKGFNMDSALTQLKPTEEQIQPSGIYSSIIKRGSLFSGLRRSFKTDKHSATQSRVDAALLR
jgi:hypothetical protein